MNVPEPYQRILADEGVPLHVINPGSNEVALPRDAALRAIQTLHDTAIAILGGDVIATEGGRLRYAGANWHSDRRPNEDATSFARRSREEATTYLKNYPLQPGHGRLFVLVLSTERTRSAMNPDDEPDETAERYYEVDFEPGDSFSFERPTDAAI